MSHRIYSLRLNTLILYFLLLLQLKAEAQNSTFRAITMDNGLSNFVVTSFCKDSTGFMWIGTDVSLDRFDGVNFKHFSFDSPEVNKKRVKAITETSSGNIFVGNSLGLWKINYQTATLEKYESEKINCGVSALKWNPLNKTLYIGSDKGLFVLKNGKLNFIAPDNNVLSGTNFIAGIEIDEKSNLWMTTRKGLCYMDSKSGKINVYENAQTSSGYSILARIVKIHNRLFIGTSKTGIIVFDITTKQFSHYLDVGSDIITDISTDGNDLLYVATDGNGVHFISTSTNQIVRSYRYEPDQKSGIRSNSVYSLLVDKFGIIWVGFYQAGLDYSLYQNQYFEVYSYGSKFNSRGLPVRAFLINKEEKLIGTREGLYFINEYKNQVVKYNKSVLRSNLVLSLCYFGGEYYIGTYGGGVSVLNPRTNQIKPLSTDFTLIKGHVFHIEASSDGNLWLATSGGVYCYNKTSNKISVYNSTNSQLLSGNVYYLFFDSYSKGWIATENGLCVYDPVTRTIKNNVFPEGFFNKEIIKVIYEDKNHKLYFCPDKGNIFVSDINMRNFSSFDLTSRFKDRVFLSILEDENKNFWFGSDNGLISIREKEDSYYSFGFSEGVPDPVFSTAASFLDDNGILWFGNAKGLLYVNKQVLKQVKHKSIAVTLTDFQVNGDVWDDEKTLDINATDEIKLNYNQNNLKFGFVSMQFTDPATVVYEYKLEGYDKDWQILPKGQNEVSYINLPSGDYQFIVRTEGNQLSERKLYIRISSFFSLTFWVIFVLLVLIIYFSASRLLKIYKLLKNKVVGMNAIIQTSLEKQNNNDEKYKYSKISESECIALTDKLYEYISTTQAFTNSEVKLVDIAQALNTSTHTLSFIFNQYLNKNYYDFMNEYRINEFKNRVNKTDISKYTLTALAEECGFSSRASFFRSFKKLTGITPNEYIRQLGKNIQMIENED